MSNIEPGGGHPGNDYGPRRAYGRRDNPDGTSDFSHPELTALMLEAAYSTYLATVKYHAENIPMLIRDIITAALRQRDADAQRHKQSATK